MTEQQIEKIQQAIRSLDCVNQWLLGGCNPVDAAHEVSLNIVLLKEVINEDAR